MVKVSVFLVPSLYGWNQCTCMLAVRWYSRPWNPGRCIWIWTICTVFLTHTLHLKYWKNAINNKRLSCIYAEENGYIQGQSFCICSVFGKCFVALHRITAPQFIRRLTAHMTCFTCRWCDSTSAHCSFTQFSRKLSAYCKHSLYHFIQRNQLMNSGKSHLSSDNCVGHTCCISVLAWIFYQTATGSQTRPSIFIRTVDAA